MYTFEVTPPLDTREQGIPIQDSEISKRACSLVIDNVARYPQVAEIPPLLIAPELVKPNTKVGIIEMAQILPDPDFCQERVKAIYRAHNAEYVYGPDRTIYHVLRFAMYALSTVRKMVIHEARSLGVLSGGEFFAEVPMTEDSNKDASLGSWRINLASAYSLDAFLNSEPQIRSATYAKLERSVPALRRAGRIQQMREESCINTYRPWPGHLSDQQ